MTIELNGVVATPKQLQEFSGPLRRREIEPATFTHQMVCLAGASATLVSGLRTNCYQWPVDFEFSGARLTIKNYGEAYTIDKLGFAVSPTSLNNGAALTWVQAFYKGGASIPVPAGTGTGTARQPGLVTLDWCDIFSTPRTDVPGGPFLILARYTVTDGYGVSTSVADGSQSSAMVLTRNGYVFGSGSATVDTLAFPTSGAISLSNNAFMPLGHLELRSLVPEAISMTGHGDSLTAGGSGGASSRQMGMLAVAQGIMRANGKVGGIANYGIGGLKQPDFYSTMRAVVAEVAPRQIYMAGFSPNQAYATKADFDAQLANCKAEIDWLVPQGIRVFVGNAMPTQTLETAQSTGTSLRNDFNRSLAALVASYGPQVVLVDLAAATEDPFTRRQAWNPYFYNALHDNYWGQRSRAMGLAMALGLTVGLDQPVKLTTAGTKLTAADARIFGRAFKGVTGATAATDRAGNADKRLPRGAAGSVRAHGSPVLDAANVQWVFGLNTTGGNPAFNAGAAGMKYGITTGTDGGYLAIIDGAAPVAINGTATIQAAKDVISFTIDADNVVKAFVSAVDAPQTDVLLHTFAAPRDSDLFPAVAVTYSGGTSAQNFGPVVGSASFI